MKRSTTIIICAALGALACEDEPAKAPEWFYITAESSGLPGNTVYDIYAGADGTWFGTERGLAFNSASDWLIYDYQGGLPSDVVFNLAVCPDGDVWMATPAGAARLRDDVIKTFTTAHGLPSDTVYSVAFDGENVWIATEKGLARFNAPGFTVFDCSAGLPGASVRDVYPVGVGRVWVACFGGVACYDRGTITEYTALGAGLPSDIVYAVAARGGDVWAGTDQGLALLRDGEVVKTYNSANSALRADIINDLAYDADGALWVATAGGGVARSVGDGFETFDSNRGMLSDYVLSVYGDKLGYVWCGTLDSGVSRYHD